MPSREIRLQELLVIHITIINNIMYKIYRWKAITQLWCFTSFCGQCQYSRFTSKSQVSVSWPLRQGKRNWTRSDFKGLQKKLSVRGFMQVFYAQLCYICCVILWADRGSQETFLAVDDIIRCRLWDKEKISKVAQPVLWIQSCTQGRSWTVGK